ncbi:MAG: aldehyde dehydrogenase family protein, partial [Oscillospiraceae bacterium]
MSNAIFKLPKAYNEPVHSYLPGSKERELIKKELKAQSEVVVDIPAIIGGKEYFTEKTGKCVMPHDFNHVLATYHIAGETELKLAADAACDAQKEWAAMPFEHRASIFLKAADLLAGPWRAKINAATMLGQSKTVFQA